MTAYEMDSEENIPAAEPSQVEDGGDEQNNEEMGDVGDPRENPPPPQNLKDISSLAHWTVSSHKPGCGIPALRSTSLTSYWQSDGPQPHTLNIHFPRMLPICYIRIFLDHTQDESYTPTKLQFLAGTMEHDLTEVCVMKFEQPRGWLAVDLRGAGGPRVKGWRGETLRCMLLQMRILENHQNGKDTHLRGLQVFAVDQDAVREGERGVGVEEDEEGQETERPMVASEGMRAREVEGDGEGEREPPRVRRTRGRRTRDLDDFAFIEEPMIR